MELIIKYYELITGKSTEDVHFKGNNYILASLGIFLDIKKPLIQYSDHSLLQKKFENPKIRG